MPFSFSRTSDTDCAGEPVLQATWSSSNVCHHIKLTGSLVFISNFSGPSLIVDGSLQLPTQIVRLALVGWPSLRPNWYVYAPTCPQGPALTSDHNSSVTVVHRVCELGVLRPQITGNEIDKGRLCYSPSVSPCNAYTSHRRFHQIKNDLQLPWRSLQLFRTLIDTISSKIAHFSKTTWTFTIFMWLVIVI